MENDEIIARLILASMAMVILLLIGHYVGIIAEIAVLGAWAINRSIE